jgi:choline dehydrogenase-like flavoprotein
VSAAAIAAGSGEVRVFADYDRDFREEADVVVVGSGPCGSVVAYELARAGKRVVLLEEGPPLVPDDFVLDGALSMARTMREGGLRTTRGTVMPTMQAICLGGGSLVNSAICVRPPDFVFQEWATHAELAHTSRAALDPHFDAVGEFLGIAPTPENVQGARNLLFARGCDALGIANEPIARNVRGCRGSGECFTGCRNRAKQSMDVSYVPAAIRAGARVLTSVQVQHVLADGRRVTGVAGRVVAPFGGRPSHRFRVDARAVVLAAGCVATPVLLRRSGNLANASGQVGENLRFHPGVAVMAVFPEPTHPQFGATQGWQSLHFLRDGFKLETLWAPSAVFAVRLPGLGHEYKQHLARIPHAALWDAIGSCNRSLGRVVPRRGSLDPVLHYRLHPDDVAILQRALWVLCEIAFAAGASAVLPGIHGVPDELRSLAECEVFRTGTLRADQVTTAGNHVFCTTRMHGDPRRGVVDELGRCHDLENLWIADTGIFPQCTGVNPMYTGMALARRGALALADRL